MSMSIDGNNPLCQIPKDLPDTEIKKLEGRLSDVMGEGDIVKAPISKLLMARRVTLIVVGFLISPVVSVLWFGLVTGVLGILTALPYTISAVINRYILMNKQEWVEAYGGNKLFFTHCFFLWIAPLMALILIILSAYYSVKYFIINMGNVAKHETTKVENHETTKVAKHETTKVENHETTEVENHETTEVAKHETTEVENHETTEVAKYETKNKEEEERVDMRAFNLLFGWLPKMLYIDLLTKLLMFSLKNTDDDLEN